MSVEETGETGESGAPEPDKIIGFHVHGHEFGLPIGAVKETVAARPIARLPFCPKAVAGLINLRGDVVPVLDLAALLGLDERGTERTGEGTAAPLPQRRFILLRQLGGGHGALCGLLVDQLAVTRRLPRGAIHPCPRALPETLTHFLSGVARIGDEDGERPRLLLLLDPERLIQAEILAPFRRTRD